MTGGTSRANKLQLSLTIGQARELHDCLTAALESGQPQPLLLAAGTWRRYLDWRATRKWGLRWRDSNEAQAGR